MRYLSTTEVLIAEHVKLARESSDAGRMQALVDADPCGQGTCDHRPAEECAVDPECEWMCGHLSERLNHHRPLNNALAMNDTACDWRCAVNQHRAGCHLSDRLNTRTAAGNR